MSTELTKPNNAQKVVFIDVDETLLDDFYRLSEKTAAAITRVRADGAEIVICTGRPRDFIEEIVRKIGVRYSITGNGSEIFDWEKGQFLFRKMIEKEVVLDIYDAIDHEYEWARVNATGGMYYVNLVRLQKDAAPRFLKESDFVRDIPREFFEQNEIMEINLRFDDKVAAEDYVRKMENKKGVRISSMRIEGESPYYCDLNPSGVSKGAAIGRFCEIFGINRENTAAIGDGRNDIEMIEAVGFGVAMGNAKAKLKEAADYITDDNNHDGVAKALEEYGKR